MIRWKQWAAIGAAGVLLAGMCSPTTPDGYYVGNDGAWQQ